MTVKVIQIKATSTVLYLYRLNRFREKNRGNRTGFHEKPINFRNRLFLRLNIPPICWLWQMFDVREFVPLVCHRFFSSVSPQQSRVSYKPYHTKKYSIYIYPYLCVTLYLYVSIYHLYVRSSHTTLFWKQCESGEHFNNILQATAYPVSGKSVRAQCLLLLRVHQTIRTGWSGENAFGNSTDKKKNPINTAGNSV